LQYNAGAPKPRSREQSKELPIVALSAEQLDAWPVVSGQLSSSRQKVPTVSLREPCSSPPKRSGRKPSSTAPLSPCVEPGTTGSEFSASRMPPRMVPSTETSSAREAPSSTLPESLVTPSCFTRSVPSSP
jgi:hypothetical protein